MQPDPGRGDRLPVDVILHVAAREDAGDARLRAVVRDDVAVGVQLELTAEQRRVRRVADGDEHAAHRHLRRARRSCSAHDHRRSLRPCRRRGSRRPRCSSSHAIFGFARALSCMIFDARSVSRRCTTVTLDANRVRNIASSIAESPPPTTAISLAAEEVAVAGRARRDAVAHQRALGRQPEQPRRRAGRDDQRLRRVLRLRRLDDDRLAQRSTRGDVALDRSRRRTSPPARASRPSDPAP